MPDLLVVRLMVDWLVVGGASLGFDGPSVVTLAMDPGPSVVDMMW